MTMNLFVKLTTFLSLISCSTSAVNSAISNGTATSYFTGLLSDVLHTNRLNNLEITPLCNQELMIIQSGLDMRDIWAIKRKCSNGYDRFHILISGCIGIINFLILNRFNLR